MLCARLVLLVVSLAASSAAAEFPAFSVHKYAISPAVRVLFSQDRTAIRFSPRIAALDSCTTPLDPLRSTCMQETSGDIRLVLDYLHQMVQYCRDEKRQDLASEYEDAVELVRARMYGELPPRKQVSYYSATLPHVQVNLEASEKTRAHQLAWASASFVDTTPDPPPDPHAGIRVNISECPRQKIIGRFYKQRGPNLVPRERLECGHEQLGPVGHEILRRSRRCIACRQEQLYAIAQNKMPPQEARVAMAVSKSEQFPVDGTHSVQGKSEGEVTAIVCAKKRLASVPIAKAKAVSA
jgi:hypothetical protein